MGTLKICRAARAAAMSVATTAALLLAACGGDSDDAQPAEDPTLVPASATSSTATWFKFASALAPTDSAEALQLGSVASLPTSETEEPLPLPQ